MLRRVLIMIGIAASTGLGLVVLAVFGWLAAVQVQNHAMSDCVGHTDKGVVGVHWKSYFPPHYACTVNGRDE